MTPSRASNAALARSRSRAMAVTSASTTVVSWAEVCSDSTMRWAMTCRARDIRSVVPRRLDSAIAGRVRRRPESGSAAWPGAAGWAPPGRCRRPGAAGAAGGAAGAGAAAPSGPGGVQHVLLADPAADTGAGHGGQVDAVLGGQLAHQRGDVRALGPVGVIAGGRRLLGRGRPQPPAPGAGPAGPAARRLSRVRVLGRGRRAPGRRSPGSRPTRATGPGTGRRSWAAAGSPAARTRCPGSWPASGTPRPAAAGTPAGRPLAAACCW